jgi:hypothetical protein
MCAARLFVVSYRGLVDHRVRKREKRRMDTVWMVVCRFASRRSCYQCGNEKEKRTMKYREKEIEQIVEIKIDTKT